MSKSIARKPLLSTWYDEYLVHQDLVRFIGAVRKRYRVPTIERLLETGNRLTRRAAVLALADLADYSSNGLLGKALTDRDRGVRILTDEAIRRVWRRLGSPPQRKQLSAVIRLIDQKKFRDAIEAATRLVNDAPWMAEAWNQRAIALFHEGDFQAAVRDCRLTLEINPYHFPAASGMGTCFLRMGDRYAALAAYRLALRLNPSLEDVRAHVVYLQRTLNQES